MVRMQDPLLHGGGATANAASFSSAKGAAPAVHYGSILRRKPSPMDVEDAQMAVIRGRRCGPSFPCHPTPIPVSADEQMPRSLHFSASTAPWNAVLTGRIRPGLACNVCIMTN